MKRDLLSSSADSEIIITLMSIRELEEAPHGDYRRTRRAWKQITFDYLETEAGEVNTGQIRPATRENLRSWLSRFEGKQAAFAPHTRDYQDRHRPKSTCRLLARRRLR